MHTNHFYVLLIVLRINRRTERKKVCQRLSYQHACKCYVHLYRLEANHISIGELYVTSRFL